MMMMMMMMKIMMIDDNDDDDDDNVRGSVWPEQYLIRKWSRGPTPLPPRLREWSKRTCFSFRSGSGCSDRIWDIFISLNSSFHDEDAGV